LLGLTAGYFYWFQWRPTQIRKDCNKLAIETEKSHMTLKSMTDISIIGRKVIEGFEYNTVYPQCLREKGLK